MDNINNTINFADIKWAYSRDGKIIIPFILNCNKDKVKNAITDEIFDSTIFFKNVKEKKLVVSSSISMVINFGKNRMENYYGFRHIEEYGKYKKVRKNELINIKNIFKKTIEEIYLNSQQKNNEQ